jgi:hypothetical protein
MRARRRRRARPVRLSPADAVTALIALDDAAVARQERITMWCPACACVPAACRAHLVDLELTGHFRRIAAVIEEQLPPAGPPDAPDVPEMIT